LQFLDNVTCNIESRLHYNKSNRRKEENDRYDYRSLDNDSNDADDGDDDDTNGTDNEYVDVSVNEYAVLRDSNKFKVKKR